MEKLLAELLKSKKTVFTFNELFLHVKNSTSHNLVLKLSYYVKKGYLYRLRRGIYTKDRSYNRFEVATKILSPAYISFETVLRKEGLIFQFYGEIFVASTHSRTILCDGQNYVFRKIKDTILTNPKGVIIRDDYSIATPERAYLDLLYVYKDYYLDNPGKLEWEKIFELLPIYENKRMEKTVDTNYAEYKKTIKENL
jgi:predicted transcriptional regulator of viral defense system